MWDPKRGGDRNAVEAVWEYCRVCDLVEQAEAAGPPTNSGLEHGWHLVLKAPEKR